MKPQDRCAMIKTSVSGEVIKITPVVRAQDKNTAGVRPVLAHALL